MANRQRDLGKEQFWRQMVARQRRSDLTIRAFCEHAGLSQPSFYQWRGELARRDRAQHDQTPPSARAAFVPVHLVPDVAVIEIVLGQGVVVRVPAGADDKTLRQVLAALATSARTISDDDTEGASC